MNNMQGFSDSSRISDISLTNRNVFGDQDSSHFHTKLDEVIGDNSAIGIAILTLTHLELNEDFEDDKRSQNQSNFMIPLVRILLNLISENFFKVYFITFRIIYFVNNILQKGQEKSKSNSYQIMPLEEQKTIAKDSEVDHKQQPQNDIPSLNIYKTKFKFSSDEGESVGEQVKAAYLTHAQKSKYFSINTKFI